MEPQRVFNIAEVAAMTPEEASRYRISEKSYWDACTLMDEATKKGLKKGIEIGIEKGVEKGRAEGISIGEERGMKKGRAEEKTNIIMGLIEEGLPLEIIARAVKLSVGQVEDIIAKKGQEPGFPKT